MKHEKLIEKHLGVNTPYWIKEKVDNAINEALRQFAVSSSVCYKECGNTQPSGGIDNICLNCGSSIKQTNR